MLLAEPPGIALILVPVKISGWFILDKIYTAEGLRPNTGRSVFILTRSTVDPKSI
jgi:hypothetical protein